MKDKLLVSVVFCVVFSIFIGVWEWTDRNIEYVCTKIEKRPVEINDGITFLVTLVGNGLVIPFNIGCEIYSACVDE